MKGPGKLIVSILMIVICIGLLIPAYLYFQRNPISQANRMKAQAKKEYFAREYLKAYKAYQFLFDSLKVKSDPASLNYANAAFMSSGILRDGFYGSSGQTTLSDSVLGMLEDVSEAEYVRLTSTKDNKIASKAANQLGYSALKKGDLFVDEDTDSVLTVALDHFKTALRKNPGNDSARYNYELIKKIVLFPETILSQAKALVAEKKYVEAQTLLENAMKRDPRLKKQTEFLDRIKLVVKIDSLYAKRI
ncbi:MAG TPA: hypothetical protein VD884_05755 [Ohtaekwangia sp.]|nr:hypothetical protein [Ohtaekwangia sp.]